MIPACVTLIVVLWLYAVNAYCGTVLGPKVLAIVNPVVVICLTWYLLSIWLATHAVHFWCPL